MPDESAFCLLLRSYGGVDGEEVGESVMPDESTFGLLLRAYGGAVAQLHGDRYFLHNEKAAKYWELAVEKIEAAMGSVTNAQMCQQVQDAVERTEKKFKKAVEP